MFVHVTSSVHGMIVHATDVTACAACIFLAACMLFPEDWFTKVRHMYEEIWPGYFEQQP